MDLNNRKTWYALDLLNFIFCIFIIALHTGGYEGDPRYYWLEKSLFRLAVPFFMVTTGFLLAVRVDKEKDIKRAISGYTKRLLVLLLVYEPVNLILSVIHWFLEGESSAAHILLLSIRSVIFYPVGALWYIQAAIVGIWISKYYIENKKIEFGLIIGGVLYFIGSLANSYFFIVEGGVLGKGVSLYIKICATARNGLFYGFLLILLGYKCYQVSVNKAINHKPAFMLMLTTFLLYIMEIAVLRDKTSLDDNSMFLMLPVFAFFLVLFCSFYVTDKEAKTKIFRNLSTGMYLLHRPLISIFMIVSLIWHLEIENSRLFITVTVLAASICLIAYRKKLYIAKYLK